MHVRGTLAPVSIRDAVDWSMESLDQGSRLSREVATTLDGGRLHAYAIVPQEGERITAAAFSQSAGIGDADRVLGGILRGIAATSGGILLVDDDLARRGDPGLDDVTFVEDRVLRWVDLHSSRDDLTGLMRSGASGYPLNAFICSDTDGGGIRPRAGSLSDADLTALAGAVRVVIHSIFDAESYLLLVLDESVNSLLESYGAAHAA